MARTAAQSDFSVSRPAQVRLPGAAEPVALAASPGSEASKGGEASEFATRWVLRLTAVLLLALAALCAVGPHIPAGE